MELASGRIRSNPAARSRPCTEFIYDPIFCSPRTAPARVCRAVQCRGGLRPSPSASQVPSGQGPGPFVPVLWWEASGTTNRDVAPTGQRPSAFNCGSPAPIRRRSRQWESPHSAMSCTGGSPPYSYVFNNGGSQAQNSRQLLPPRPRRIPSQRQMRARRAPDRRRPRSPSAAAVAVAAAARSLARATRARRR